MQCYMVEFLNVSDRDEVGDGLLSVGSSSNDSESEDESREVWKSENEKGDRDAGSVGSERECGSVWLVARRHVERHWLGVRAPIVALNLLSNLIYRLCRRYMTCQ